MSGLSKKDSIKKCYDVWDYIATYGCSKDVAINMTNGGGDKWPVNSCYTCEYTYKTIDRDCEGCYLIDLWGPKDDLEEPYKTLDATACENSNSPYYLYTKAFSAGNIIEAKIQARIIADYCKKLLDSYEEEVV